MNSKTKGFALLGSAFAFVCCMGAGVATKAFAAQDDQADGSATTDWFKAPEDGAGLPASWTLNDDGTVTGTNRGFLGDFLLTTNESLVGDYSVEATFKGTKDTEVTEDINFGIVPWFQDKANYAIIYLQWRPANKFNLINVQTIAFENGVQTPWADHWLDNLYATTLYQLNPTDTITVHVDKTLNATATADTYKVTISAEKNGTVISESPATIDFSVSAPKAATQAMAGVYVWNDTVTVSDFKTQSLTQTGVYKSVSGSEGTTGRSTSAEGWVYENGTYSVDASAGNSLQNQAVLKNSFADGNYRIGYTAHCEGGSDRQLSILPLYRNENNYVRFVLTQTERGATIAADGKSDGTPFAQTAVDYEGAIDWTNVKLSASKEGTTFTCYINDATAATYTNASFNDGANVAFGAGSASAEFSALTVESLEYVPYDWFAVEGFYVSARTEESVAVTPNEDDNTLAIVMNSSAEETEYTRLYKASGMYNEVSVSGKFTAAEGASYGFYLSFTDKENYVVALIENGKASVKSVTDGAEMVIAEADLPDGFVVTDENLLKATAKFSAVTVELNGAVVLTGEVSALAESETGNIGAAAIGGKVEITDFAVDGFWPNRDRTEGVWTLRGRRIGTWSIGDAAITADGSHGTDFLNTIATTRMSYSPADGYYVGAAVTVTQLYNSEWKTGIMPYYKDANNNIFVWLSQWNGGATTITMRGVLNGKVVGNEWRETAVAYTMENAVNYLEVYVHGDGIYVYLNKSFAPVVTTSFEGLSAMPTAGYGLTVLNTSATFGELATSDSRIFKETGTPTIEKISGTMPTEGKVGTELRIPVFSATGVGGATAEITLTVTDPENREVELKANKFTPEHNGDYTVTVTATDAWGNTDTQTYTINVTGGKKGGCNSSLAIAAGVVLPSVAVAAVGAAILIRKKKKN